MNSIPSLVFDNVGHLHREHLKIENDIREAQDSKLWRTMDLRERTQMEVIASLSRPQSVAASSLLWITSDMVRLMLHAATSLPPYAFDPAILPWQNALVFSESPLMRHKSLLDARDITAVQWLSERDYHWIALLGRGEAAGRNLFYRMIVSLHPGDSLSDDETSYSIDPDTGRVSEIRAGDSVTSREDIARLLCTLWLLLRQKVAVRRIETASRAERRRSLRDSGREPPEITVIELRRPVNALSGSGSSHPVDWSHRWIVGGHWRNQYHPSDGRHEPTWIAPYVKGPEEKPLVVKDRVHAWVR